MRLIKEALTDLRSLKELNIPRTAKKHNANRTTLLRRWNNVTGLKQAGYDR
jgi:hypothetical protein